MIRLPVVLVVAVLAGCGASPGPGARELNNLVVDPAVGFTVKLASPSAAPAQPTADLAVRDFQSLGCEARSGEEDVVGCRFLLTLFNPEQPGDPGNRYTGSGLFARQGERWVARQQDYVLEPAKTSS